MKKIRINIKNFIYAFAFICAIVFDNIIVNVIGLLLAVALAAELNDKDKSKDVI